MIAAAKPSPDEEPEEPKGVLGDGALRPGKYNMRLVKRAIREDWPISADVRKLLVDQMEAVVRLGQSDRAKIGAALVLISADNVNAKREAMDQKDEHVYLPKTVLHVHADSVPRLSDDDLERITVTGRFEESGSGGASVEATGEGEPA